MESESGQPGSAIQRQHPHPRPGEIRLSAPRPLYFAYGSNLSFTQMRQRCTHDPSVSARPLAIARLDRWRWFICERGYANVLPPEDFLRVGRQVTDGDDVPVSGPEDAVYGVLYELTPADERLLDAYEGVDHDALLAPPVKFNRAIRPREQGKGAYNKWYVPAVVTRWLVDDGEQQQHVQTGIKTQTETVTVTVLVYVDEERVRVGPPKTEYIARMERAIREAETLGFPGSWAEGVMRRFLLPPIIPTPAPLPPCAAQGGS